MKILHLFSDWKWTGPAGPALNMALGMKSRGHDVFFACSPLPFDALDSIEKHAVKAGITPLTSFNLSKHFHIRKNIQDRKKVSDFIDQKHIDIIHTHRQQDHLLGGLSARRSKTKPKIVRTSHDAVPLKKSFRNDIIMRNMTDQLLCISQSAMKADAETFSLPPDKISYIPPAIDTDKINPEIITGNIRDELGIAPDIVILGIVARIQTHRRYDDLLQAFKKISPDLPNLRLMIIGRGTKMEELVEKPIKELGLTDTVILAGYRREDYLQAVNTLDAKIFLVPGSDGSCRAAREAMALGKPIIASTLGILPEIVTNNENGYLIDNTIDQLAEAMKKIASDPDLRTRMGQASLQKTQNNLTLRHQTALVEQIYEKLLT